MDRPKTGSLASDPTGHATPNDSSAAPLVDSSASAQVSTEPQTATELSMDSLKLDDGQQQTLQLNQGPQAHDVRFTASEKGKGRLVEPAKAEAEAEIDQQPPLAPTTPHVEHIALGEDPLSAEPESEPAEPPPAPAPRLNQATTPPSAQEGRPPTPPAKTVEREEEWPLKSIAFPPLPPPPSSAEGHIETSGPTIKIICQNLNGPCSFIALCNVLILRGDIHITPPSRKSATYSYLSALVGDYLLRTSSPSAPLSLEAALEILPSTRYGLNLNPRFGHIDGFRQAGDAENEKSSGELALFATARVPLLHGWVVDPQDEDTWDAVVEKTGDYDSALEKLVEADVIAGEQVEDGEEDEAKLFEAIRKRSLWTPEQEEKVRQAHLIRRFLTSSQTQLTYHGLFLLSTHLAPNSLSALFRNSHLSVVFRRPSTPTPSNTPQLGDEGPQLFTLVTDESFANEPDVVWESLEDVEGGMSDFYDGALRRAHPRGGDWVRRRRNDSQTDGGARATQKQRGSMSAVEEVERFERNQSLPANDLALAQQLQHEEDALAHQQHEDSRPRRETGSDRLRRLHAAERAPAVLAPGALSVGPEAIAGPPPREMSRAEREKERARLKKAEKEKKDKCVVS